eukprot:TRINITY_DN33561_c0_g1_i1.p1 TRINITY_DN33561_c0_g1~~TRINITY_DN33561_c0_g1_i1.p1  ORF type:complete len:485 (+),score=78.09 TRINITY_DN33561_c0_g1_i1:36-1490(+)
MRALLLIFACTAVSGDIPLKSNSYSSLFGAKRGKARNQGVRVISDLAATVNDLVEGMLWSDYGTGLENQNVGDMVMKKMMRGLGRKGSKEPTMEEVRANSKECKASVNQEEHNSHVTKHDEVKTRKAVALQTSTTEEEDVDLTEDQRKAYEKQQEELANSLNQVQERVFCTNGLKVYPNATFVCDGSSASIGSLEWLAMSEVDRSKCQASSDTTSCVCPRDINPSVISGVAACDQDVAMFCTVNITTPSINECPPYVYNLDWLKPCHWYSVQDTLSVSVTLTCTFNFSEPTFEGLNIDEKYITEDYGGGSYSVKTVEEVRNTSFPQRAVGMADELGLSPGNWLLGNISGTLGIPHKFTYKLYNFNRPGDNAWRFDTDIADFEPGQLTGEKPFTYSIDLATVPARYYQGGRIYSEAGLLFSPNHTAKLLIDFIDYDPVAIGSSSDSQLAGYVIFIVLTCIFVVAGAGFMWLNTKVRIRELNHNLE